MTTARNDIERTIEKTKDQFLKTAKRATTELDRQRKRLMQQVDALEKVLMSARKDAVRFRDDLQPVMDDLVNARNHLAHALRVDKALASIQRELKRNPAEDRAASKKVASRKKASKKPAAKKATRKKAAPRKKAASKAATVEKKEAPTAKKAA